MSILISIENLLSGKYVEGTRMEFKEGWNPKTIMRSICAFANDYENEGSGYIIIGVAEKNGKPIRPVKGFNPNEFEKIQKKLIGYCNHISPAYVPRLSIENIDNKQVLVIWIPAGSNRPYKVPDDVLAKTKVYNYRIRQFSSSVVPNNEQEIELIQLTAKVPFDDRVNTMASINELDFGLMREHLAKTESKLFIESSTMTIEELAQKMNLCQGASEHLFPKNVGLLMFSANPNNYFNGIKIDVVQFPEGLGAKKFEANTFEGPIQKQLTDVLSFIKTHIVKSKIIKYADKAEADTLYNYPYEAIEEALSNAVYHRNYETREPIEVRILPSSIEIISYNGVDPSLKQSDFDKGIIRNRRYRNRRIGEFLKELQLTEGKGTGIPTMIRVLNKNGSLNPKFDTNEPERSSFITELLIHTAFEKDTNINNVEKEININFIRNLKKEFGLVSERILLNSEENNYFFKQNYTKFSDYLNANFGINNDFLRNKFRNKAIDKILFVLMIITIDPNISAYNISKIFGLSSRTIENYISELKNINILIRKDSKKTGSWKIIGIK